jgi:hypothetical protein
MISSSSGSREEDAFIMAIPRPNSHHSSPLAIIISNLFRSSATIFELINFALASKASRPL